LSGNSIDSADLPEGLLAGFGMSGSGPVDTGPQSRMPWSHANMDGDVALDNFEVCPA
jgi:hypothetical protein